MLTFKQWLNEDTHPIIHQIMKDHGITTKHEGTNHFALDVVKGPKNEDASKWVKYNGWSVGKTKKWLGY